MRKYSPIVLLLIALNPAIAAINPLIRTDNTLIYPVSLHYYKGKYYIGDRGREAILAFKNGKITTLYHSNDNTKIDIPLSLSDDNSDSIIVGDVGVGALSKVNIQTGLISQFSPPKGASGLGPRFITKYTNGWYVFTHIGKHPIVKVDSSGNQTPLELTGFSSPYGIASFIDYKNTPSFAIADGASGVLFSVSHDARSAPVPLCDGGQLQFPFSVVSLKNKIYFDDVVLHALFSYDIKTRACVKISGNFKIPMDMTVAGSNIGIIDAGKRALIEYNPAKNSFKELYQDRSPIMTLLQPWDFFVTKNNVYLTDYKRGSVLEISKKTHKISVVSSPSRGTGAPFLTAYAIAALENSNYFYVSDASQDVIMKVNRTNGDRTMFSAPGKQKGIDFGDPTHMTFDHGNIYVSDWSNSDVIKVDSVGNRSELTKLKNPPMGISSVIDRNFYVTQPTVGNITRINIATGNATQLPLKCTNLKAPLGIVALNKNTLLISDAATNNIDRINLKKNICEKIAAIPVTGRERAFTMKPYDSKHIIINVFNGNKLYLVNEETGKVKNFFIANEAE